MSSSPMQSIETQAPPPPTPAVKKQKLKFACDACSRRKISCPKQQPECGRCISEGRRCVYSPSCRNGKRKSTKTLNAAAGNPEQRRPEPVTTSTSSSLSSDNENPFTPAVLMKGSPSAADLASELASAGMSGLPWTLPNDLCFTTNSLHEALGQAVGNPVTNVSPSETLLNSTNYFNDEPPMFPGTEFHPTPYTRPLAWPLQQTSPPLTASSYRTDSSLDLTPWSSASYSSSSFSSTDLETALLADQALPDLYQRPHESCFARTCSLLKMLKRPTSKGCIFDPMHMPSPGAQHNPMASSVEKILQTTDMAVEHVTSVMQCACNTTSSVRYALTLALLEVMSWYEIIVLALHRQQAKGDTSGSSPSSNFDDAEHDSGWGSSPRTPVDSPDSDIANRVSIPSVSIGDMQIHGAEANGILSTLVRARIAKIRKMVASMSIDGGAFLTATL
jgi:hypothetical protein